MTVRMQMLNELLEIFDDASCLFFFENEVFDHEIDLHQHVGDGAFGPEFQSGHPPIEVEELTGVPKDAQTDVFHPEVSALAVIRAAQPNEMLETRQIIRKEIVEKRHVSGRIVQGVPNVGHCRKHAPSFFQILGERRNITNKGRSYRTQMGGELADALEFLYIDVKLREQQEQFVGR